MNLKLLEKQAEELKTVKSEFDKLKGELGMELEAVRSDLNELERYQQLKEQLQKQVEEQKNEAKSKIQELTNMVLREQKRYQELVSGISKEKDDLAKERIEAQSIEESERVLNKRLIDMKNMIGLMEKRISDEDMSIKNSELHIGKLNALVEEIKQRVDEEKAVIGPLIEKSREQEKLVMGLQERILAKIAQKQESAVNIREITGKVRDFLDKKLAVVSLVDRVNKDRDELEKSLIELIKKAKAFQLSASKEDVGKQMIELEKKFEEVDKKKSQFEGELKQFGTMFKR